MQAFSRLVGRLAPQHPDRPASQDGDKYGCFSIGIGFCDAERSLSGEKHRRPLLLQTFSDRRAVLRRSIHRARQDQKERSAAIFQREAGFARLAAFGQREARTAFSPRARAFSKIPAEAKRRSPPPMFWPPAGSGANETRASAEAHFGGRGPGDVRETVSALFLGRRENTDDRKWFRS